MTLAGSVYRELVFGGHLLALGTSSMAATVALVIGRAPTWDLLLMAYLFSLGAYTVNRISDFDQDRISHPERTNFLQGRLSALIWISVGSFALGYALAFFRNIYFLAGLVVPLLLAIGYSVSSRKMRGALGSPGSRREYSSKTWRFL